MARSATRVSRPRLGATTVLVGLVASAFVAAARTAPPAAAEPTLPTILLRALDAGDADAVAKLFVDDAVLFVLDHGDQPIRVEGTAAIRSWVETWKPQDEAGPATEPLSAKRISTTADVRIFAFEFERAGEPARRYRATLAAELRGEEDARTLQAIHLHVSSSERDDY